MNINDKLYFPEIKEIRLFNKLEICPNCGYFILPYKETVKKVAYHNTSPPQELYDKIELDNNEYCPLCGHIFNR